jgi:hypothetical protein
VAVLLCLLIQLLFQQAFCLTVSLCGCLPASLTSVSTGRAPCLSREEPYCDPRSTIRLYGLTEGGWTMSPGSITVMMS